MYRYHSFYIFRWIRYRKQNGYIVVGVTTKRNICYICYKRWLKECTSCCNALKAKCNELVHKTFIIVGLINGDGIIYNIEKLCGR